jgi:hypothetical protein
MIYNSTVICEFCNEIFRTYTVVICYFGISIVKDNENYQLVFKTIAGKCSLVLGKTKIEPRDFSIVVVMYSHSITAPLQQHHKVFFHIRL